LDPDHPDDEEFPLAHNGGSTIDGGFMKVILIEDIPSLGKAGDIVQVAAGYGRNFLIPRKLALVSSDANIQYLEKQRKSFLQKASSEKQNASDLAQKIDSLACLFTRPAGESEKLFGSVTSIDLQKFLLEQGISIDRRKILLPNPIKKLGSFVIPVKLHPEVAAQLKINIIRASTEPEKA
jgi:large subunit ribosomal protein L9